MIKRNAEQKSEKKIDSGGLLGEELGIAGMRQDAKRLARLRLGSSATRKMNLNLSWRRNPKTISFPPSTVPTLRSAPQVSMESRSSAGLVMRIRKLRRIPFFRVTCVRTVPRRYIKYSPLRHCTAEAEAPTDGEAICGA